jgi:hypothetical protein
MTYSENSILTILTGLPAASYEASDRPRVGLHGATSYRISSDLHRVTSFFSGSLTLLDVGEHLCRIHEDFDFATGSDQLFLMGDALLDLRIEELEGFWEIASTYQNLDAPGRWALVCCDPRSRRACEDFRLLALTRDFAIEVQLFDQADVARSWLDQCPSAI